MNVLIRNEYRVEVSLSSEELLCYGITYEELDYGNIQTRKFLWSVTEDIRKNYDYNIRLSGRMLIEVTKAAGNDITIYFSMLSPAESDSLSLKLLTKAELPPVIAQFGSFEALLEAAVRTGEKEACSLYEKDGIYRLVFPPKSSNEELISSICEFSDSIEESLVEEARCNELWRLLSAPFAAKSLTQAFLTD